MTLRPFVFDDVHDVVAYASDPEWSRFLPIPSASYSEEDARKFIALQILLDWKSHASWAIVHDAKVVGGINVRFPKEPCIGEMGYSVARPLWGRGLATEAACVVVDHVFATLPDVVRLRAMADARNIGSRRVLEKSGFSCEGVLRSNRVVRGEPIDEAWFGLLRGDWARSR